MLNDLAKLIAIDSVLGEKAENAPFGIAVREALDTALAIGAERGLKPTNIDGYCGYLDLGEGEDIIGILCHLDIVPCGEGWTYPPLQLTIDNGNIYGRGVADDKGATIASIYALSQLVDYPLKHKIRIILGCNEENGSECIKHYIASGQTIPKVSIVPDSDFPIVSSEKGIIHLTLELDADNVTTDNFTALEGGERANVVPNSSKLVLRHGAILDNLLVKNLTTIDLLKTYPFVNYIYGSGDTENSYSVNYNNDLSCDSDSLTIVANGVSAHAMQPEKGDNSNWKILSIANLLAENKSAVLEKLATLCSPDADKILGIDSEDIESGKLTINMGIVKLVDAKLQVTFDLRIPISASYEATRDKILQYLASPTIIDSYYCPNLYINANNKLVKTLLSVYSSVTKNEPFTVKTGGGTYARQLPNSIAFGPTFPDEITNIHNVDECMKLDSLLSLVDIYCEAIKALDKLKW